MKLWRWIVRMDLGMFAVLAAIIGIWYVLAWVPGSGIALLVLLVIWLTRLIEPEVK